jgi:PAS domain S-box-containing protein
MTTAAAEVLEKTGSERELRAAIAQLQYIVDMMPAYVARCTRARRFAWINRRYAERFGLTPEEVVGQSISDIVGESAYRSALPYIDRALAGETVEFEVEISYRCQPPRWMHMTYVPTLDASGAPDGWIAVVTDIENRKAIEMAQVRQAAELQAVFDTAPVGIIVAQDRECRVITANRVMAEMLGMSIGENISKSRSDAEALPYVVCRDGAVVAAEDLPMQRAAALGIELREEVLDIVRQDGSQITQLVNAAPVRDASGAVTGAVGIAADITGLRAAQEALRESEQRFRLALASGAVTAFEQDLNLRYTWVYPPEPAFPEHQIGQTDLELLPDRGGEELMQLKRRVIDTGQGTRATIRVVLASGVRHYDLLVEPRYDRAGRVVGVGGAALDVTAQKLVEESLKEADRHKDEFLATLAHELRNPLAPIAGAAEVLRMIGPPDAELQAIQDVIERQVRHLTRLVDDLLDVSRVSLGKVTLRKRRLDVASVIAAAVETSRPAIQAAGQELALALPAEPLVIEGDLTRLAQVVGNLLHNAAKFANGPGRISVEAGNDGDWAKIAVSDTGIGIPSEMLARIFELFTQVETGVDRSHAGLGIGLTLAKNLVEMHGGSIAAQSAGPGQGSVFIVRLPLAHSPILSDQPNGRADDRNRSAVPCGRVLVVDDNVDSAVTVTQLLMLIGNDVRMAHSGACALDAAAAFRPSVVFIDLGMPGMSGFEVARRIREHPELGATRLVALTGWGQPDDRARTRQAGFDEHLVKPVDLATLRSVLADWAEPKSRES